MEAFTLPPQSMRQCSDSRGSLPALYVTARASIFIEAALIALRELGVNHLPCDLVRGPDLDSRWEPVGVVEGAGGDIHVIWARRPTIADQAAAAPTMEPFEPGRRGIGRWEAPQPFEIGDVEHRPSNIGASACPPARAAVTKGRSHRVARDSVADRSAQAAALRWLSRHACSGRTGAAASSPTTVVHSRTCQRATRPPVT